MPSDLPEEIARNRCLSREAIRLRGHTVLFFIGRRCTSDRPWPS